MKTIDKALGLCTKIVCQLAGLGVVVVNGAVGSVKPYPGVTIVTLATIAVIARMAYVSGIIRGQGL